MSHAAKAPPPLDDATFARFRELILKRTGMLFGDRRREALTRAVAEHAHRATDGDLPTYYAQLDENPTNSDLWDDLIRALTINETYFFRDPEQIEALRRHILPDLIARHWVDRTLRLWSAGCSTGEEPYTLAILLRQLLPDLHQWNIQILGTDLDKQALQIASQAHYRAWSFRQTDSAVRQAYFTPQGEGFVLAPHVQRMVNFAYLNLAEDAYPSVANHTAGLDLILCRNVTIYLPEPVIREVADRFYQCLTPGGWLVVGPSETDDKYYSQFHTLRFTGAIVYQKVAGTRSSPAPMPKASPAAPPESFSQPAAPVGPRAERPPSPAPKPELPQPWRPLAPIKPLPPAARPLSTAPAQLFDNGARLLAERRYDEARQCFIDFLNQKPGDPAALHHLARLEANAGRLAEARRWAERALEADPLHCEAHFTLAQIHQEQGELEQAIARYKKALYLNPDFVLAHFSLANLYQRSGQAADSARHRSQALRLAAKLPPEAVLFGSDDLTAGHLVSTAQGT